MNAELTFLQSTNFFQPNTGTLSFVAVNNALTRMVVPTDGYDQRYGQIYYFTRASASDAWSNKIAISGIPIANMRWTCASMSADGNRLVVIGYSMPPYTFKWINGAYVFQGTISTPPNASCAGLNMTSDGSRIAISTVGGYSYFATWNASTNNYNALIQTLDTTIRNVSNNQYGNLAMSANGNRIAYCDYNSQNVPSFIFAEWNGSNYSAYTAISALNGHLSLCCGGAFTPDGGCLLVNATQPMYGYFNGSNFTSFVNIPSNIISPLSGMYYINIFSITHDGLHLFWNVNRDDMTIKMIELEYSTPPLYLGDKMTISGSNINFNNANVYVKDPTVGLNVVNKQYVDAMAEAANTMILSNANTDTTSNTIYYDLLSERQVFQSNLAIQIENLYQYFFNASRTEAVLFGPSFLNPLSLSGCCLWMDGADAGTITKSGSLITNWADKSSSGYQFTQSNTSHSPTYLTNSLNNNSVLSFSSSSQTYLGGPTGFELGTNSYAIFAVCKFNDTNSVACIFNRSLYGGAANRLLFLREGGGAGYLAGFLHTGANILTTPQTSISDYVIFELIINRVQGNDAIFINGDKKTESSYASDSTYSAGGFMNMIIGGYNNPSGGINPPQPNCYLNGYIAEIVAYANPTDMTNENRQEVEGYLATKWGLQSHLPTGHPSKI